MANEPADEWVPIEAPAAAPAKEPADEWVPVEASASAGVAPAAEPAAEPDATAGSLATQVAAGAGHTTTDMLNFASPGYDAISKASHGLNKMIGTPTIPSAGEIARKGLGYIGMNPDDYPAQNAPERIARFTGEALPWAVTPGGAPKIVAGALPAIGRVAGRIGTQLSSGLAGGTLGEVVPEKFRPVGQVVGSLIGGGLPGGLKDAVTAGGQSVARDKLTQTAADLGVTMPRVLTTPSVAQQRVGTALSNVPLVGEPIFESVKNSVQQVGRAADKAREGYGSGNMETSGSGAKDAIVNWILGPNTAAGVPTGSRAVTDRVYSKVDALVNNDHYGPADYTRNALGDIAARTNNAGIPRGPQFQAVLDRVQDPRGMNYEGLKDMRTWIGQHIENKLLPTDIPRQFLDKIYMGLTNDLRTVVRDSGGPKALEAWNVANSTASNVAARKEALAGIVGVKGDATPAQVFDRLYGYSTTGSRADTHRLMLARKAMGPDAWNEVASAMIARTIVGKDKMTFSPEVFVSQYGKLSPAAKNILFRSSGKGELADALDKVLYVSREIGERHTKFGNPSGTGRTMMGAAGIGGFLVEPLTALTTLVGSRGVAYYLASPHRASATADWLAAHQNSMMNPNVMTNNILERATRNLLAAGEGGTEASQKTQQQQQPDTGKQ